MHQAHRLIEVRLYKWPRRATTACYARYLGEDAYGHWIGVAQGDPWWTADRSQTGQHVAALAKLIPQNTYWTACFHPYDPVIDVDIVLPVKWKPDILEEVDLEVDILRNADGCVYMRDQDKFDQLRIAASIPDTIVRQVEETCAQVRLWVEQGVEPFGTAYQSWLSMAMTDR